jgi:hypothetical protein
LDKDFSKNTFRTFEFGGVWGYRGEFPDAKIGNMIWYVTRRGKMVLLKLSDKKDIVVSPNEVEEFVKQLK